MREWTSEDVPRAVPIYGDAEVMRYMGNADLTPEGVARGVARTMRRQRLHGLSFWCLTRKADGEILGHCGLQHWEGTVDVELGYVLAREHQGRGYATEAGRAAVRYGLATLGLPRVVAVALPENAPSIRVMERVGMTFRKRTVYKGFEVVLYAVDRQNLPT